MIASEISRIRRNSCFFIFTGIAFLLLCLGSCKRDWHDDGIIQTSGSMVEWDMFLNISRAIVDADGSGYFEDGDTVVVNFCNMQDGSSKFYTLYLSDGHWMPEISWREIGNDVRFTAWYTSSANGLYNASKTSSDYIHTLEVNQNGEGYDNSDLLFAQVRARAGEKVRLRFEHILSRLRIILESKDGSYSDSDLQKVEVEVMTPCQLPFNLAEGVLNTPYGYEWIAPVRQSDNTFLALLCPQKAESMNDIGWIRVKADGKEKIVNIPETVDGKEFVGLEAGKELIYRLNLQRESTEDEFAGTVRWVYGVKEPADGQWNSDHTQLSWTEGCGWFDCNKINPSDVSASGDGLMCWAAAASNLIHWWLQQNSETEAVKSYKGPAAVPSDMLHSEIFQLYKNNFPNSGEYPIKAINWFFNGVFQRKIYDTDPVSPVAGFFRDELGTQSLGNEYLGTDLARDRFNAIIKQALLSRQGIMFVVNLGKAWTTHAVTLWGVKFDDDGFIDTLYMVDNNDGRYDARGTIRTMKVRYLPYSDNNPELYPYVPNSLGDFTIRIESLCTLSLGREWIN